MSGLKVWIDQDLCTGDGLCAEIEPSVFFMHDDGLAYVKSKGDASGLGSDGTPKYKMAEGTVRISEDVLETVIESAEECPGECIFIEA